VSRGKPLSALSAPHASTAVLRGAAAAHLPPLRPGGTWSLEHGAVTGAQ